MADGDVTIYGPTTPDKLKALVEAGNHVVADTHVLCPIGVGQVICMVVSSS
jgi:hypothetical protein